VINSAAKASYIAAIHDGGQSKIFARLDFPLAGKPD
jgi:hypothetical protein